MASVVESIDVNVPVRTAYDQWTQFEEGDLERFKEFIEARGVETGGWRGEIPAGSR